MDEILRGLPDHSLVLDLGCGSGTFDYTDRNFTVVGVDLEPGRKANFVQADAAKLPFLDNTFDAVISNNSLEHVIKYLDALSEIGRVLKPSGSIYIAVPDATTITDRVYRSLARGGGHVNQFSSATQLAAQIERATGLHLVATRTLCSSFSFLNRANRRSPAAMRLLLLGGGTQLSLLLLNRVLRLLDYLFQSRLSVYGWALFFGHFEEKIDSDAWTNVCVLCGAGHSSYWLTESKLVHQNLLSFYRCPNCGTLNLFTDDKHYRHLNEGGLHGRSPDL